MKLTIKSTLIVLLFSELSATSVHARPLSWHFNHTQDTFSIFADGRDTELRTAGVSTFGISLQHPTLPLSLHIDGLWLNRDDPFTPIIGDFNGVSNIAGQESIRLHHNVLRYGTNKDQWSWTAGQLVIEDTFMNMQEASRLINSAFGTPSIVTGNTLIPTYPLTSLGATVSHQWLNKNIFTRFGIYDGNAGTEESNSHGTRLGIHGDDGVLIVSETGWRLPLATGYGILSVGAWFHSGEFVDLRQGELKRNNAAVYGMFEGRTTWQAIQFGYFGRLSATLTKNRSLVDHAFEVGINWYGPWSKRPDDQLSLGYILTNFTRQAIAFEERNGGISVRQDEQILELMYHARFTDWLSLQPGAQWIHNAHRGVKDALLVGLRLSADF